MPRPFEGWHVEFWRILLRARLFAYHCGELNDARFVCVARRLTATGAVANERILPDSIASLLETKVARRRYHHGGGGDGVQAKGSHRDTPARFRFCLCVSTYFLPLKQYKPMIWSRGNRKSEWSPKERIFGHRRLLCRVCVAAFTPRSQVRGPSQSD